MDEVWELNPQTGRRVQVTINPQQKSGLRLMNNEQRSSFALKGGDISTSSGYGRLQRTQSSTMSDDSGMECPNTCRGEQSLTSQAVDELIAQKDGFQSTRRNTAADYFE